MIPPEKINSEGINRSYLGGLVKRPSTSRGRLSPVPASGGMKPLEFTSSGGRGGALSRLLKSRFFTFYKVIQFEQVKILYQGVIGLSRVSLFI
jgi:hypothetical protein